ncbi:CPBP family intramembrane glutamic endopeptidase [Polluticaenibacter yanchengensis]|uniref:CPBP family intramembrane metalloprotease n=1 Tax=Polluticaenibacter yanchengensis TaxID=3014562 RepID=A0ABT4UQM2_9BACT|nr:CPBP family intramembrane metalloprotease [Chitinophagaceae bacterium LY-5]
MKNKINYLAILTFYIIAIVLRYLTNKTALLNSLPDNFLKVILKGIGPAAGALIVFTVFKIKPVLSLKGNYKTLLAPFLLYWAVPILLISAVAWFINGSIPVIAVSAVLVYGLLEEIGWRGFLQQELKSLPGFLNILIVAILWFIWHLNVDLTGTNLLFFGILLLGSWGIGKVADSTNSLLAVSAFHSLNNFFPAINNRNLTIIIILLSFWIIALIIRKKQQTKARIHTRQ